MSPDTKAAQVNLRFVPALKAAAEKAAARDHRSLTSLIEKLLADHLQSQPTLESWHDRAQARYLRLISDQKIGLEKQKSTVAWSYCIRLADGQGIPPHQLQEKLRLVSGQLDRVTACANVFYPYTRPELHPYFTSDSELKRGSFDEVLECFGFPPVLLELEFWRVSPVGLATSIGPLQEDCGRPNQHSLEPGQWLSPFFMVRDLAAFVFHAHYFAKEFPSVERIEFRCEWSGLLERTLADPHPLGRWRPGNISRTDHRIVTGEWGSADIASDWPKIISALAGPVLRLFEPTFPCSPEWVRDQAVHFRR
jgi:hypothetical protein